MDGCPTMHVVHQHPTSHIPPVTPLRHRHHHYTASCTALRCASHCTTAHHITQTAHTTSRRLRTPHLTSRASRHWHCPVLPTLPLHGPQLPRFYTVPPTLPRFYTVTTNTPHESLARSLLSSLVCTIPPTRMLLQSQLPQVHTSPAVPCIAPHIHFCIALYCPRCTLPPQFSTSRLRFRLAP